jgi:hypothetical protein
VRCVRVAAQRSTCRVCRFVSTVSKSRTCLRVRRTLRGGSRATTSENCWARCTRFAVPVHVDVCCHCVGADVRRWCKCYCFRWSSLPAFLATRLE